MMTRLRLLMICFWVIISSGNLNARHPHSPSTSPEKHVALFIFGDSLFDAGNNNYINTTTNYQANFFPYGETFFKYPTGRFSDGRIIHDFIGNNNYINTTTNYQANFFPYGETFFKYPTGRFSDGRIIPDFIAEFAKLPLIPTFLPSTNQEFTYGVNFASGGAGVLAETHQGFVISLKTQVSYFKIVEEQLKQKLGDTAAKKLVSDAVYLFNVGTNDYIVPLTTNSSVLQSDYLKKQFVDMVIGNLTTAIKEIYKKGGRKFGIVSVGPLGCVPFLKALSGSCLENGLELPKLHDKALSKLLQDLETQLKGFAYSKHDFYKSLLKRINNPSKYGFKEAMACCGSGPFRGSTSCGGKSGIKEYELCDNPEDHVFFDNVHLSEKGNKQIAELIWRGTLDVTGPYNLKTLFELII